MRCFTCGKVHRNGEGWYEPECWGHGLKWDIQHLLCPKCSRIARRLRIHQNWFGSADGRLIECPTREILIACTLAGTSPD